jgi:hypothetical protein
MKLAFLFLFLISLNHNNSKLVRDLTCMLVKELNECDIIQGKYSNNFYLEYIDDLKGYNLNVFDTLADGSLDIKLIVDTILIKGERFLYEKCSTKLVKSNNNKIRGLKQNQVSKTNSIRISWPLFSVDRETAIFFVDKRCGYLCGSQHLYIYGINNKEWVLEEMIILYMS